VVAVFYTAEGGYGDGTGIVASGVETYAFTLLFETYAFTVLLREG
jgi:hypothetical protein